MDLPADKFVIDFLAEYSDEAVLSELRRIAALLPNGAPLTATAYRLHSPRVSHSTIQRRFGGWREALERAGLGTLYNGATVSRKMKLQASRKFSNDDLLVELNRVHFAVGKDWLSSNDFNSHSPISHSAIRSRFGSFRRALELAGIGSHPSSNQSFTDEQCFENLAKVWTNYGRTPRFLEMSRAPSTIRGRTYERRWGTWRKSLATFIGWANGNEGSSQADKDVIGISVAKIKGGESDKREVRPGLRFKVFNRDGFRCLACGRSPATHLNVELHADHIVAWANSGRTTLENLQTLCQDCNLGKGRD